MSIKTSNSLRPDMCLTLVIAHNSRGEKLCAKIIPLELPFKGDSNDINAKLKPDIVSKSGHGTQVEGKVVCHKWCC